MPDDRPWLRFYGRVPRSIDYPRVTLYEALAATAGATFSMTGTVLNIGSGDIGSSFTNLFQISNGASYYDTRTVSAGPITAGNGQGADCRAT